MRPGARQVTREQDSQRRNNSGDVDAEAEFAHARTVRAGAAASIPGQWRRKSAEALGFGIALQQSFDRIAGGH